MPTSAFLSTHPPLVDLSPSNPYFVLRQIKHHKHILQPTIPQHRSPTRRSLNRQRALPRPRSDRWTTHSPSSPIHQIIRTNEERLACNCDTDAWRSGGTTNDVYLGVRIKDRSGLEERRNIIRNSVGKVNERGPAVNDDVLSASGVVLRRDGGARGLGDTEAVDGDAVVCVDATGDGDDGGFGPGRGVVSYVGDAADGYYATGGARGGCAGGASAV